MSGGAIHTHGHDESVLRSHRWRTAWWGGMWAERMLRSDLAGQLLAAGMATEAGLRRISRGWRTWAAADDGWFSVLHGEVLCPA